MADKTILELNDIGQLQETDKLPMARPGTTTSNNTSMAEIKRFVNEEPVAALMALIEALNQTKADKDGSYNSLTAGFSKEILPLNEDSTKELNASFIGRTTAGNTTIPATGITTLDKVVGAWDNVKKECFNPIGGFLSLGGNWFRPSKVMVGYRLSKTGVVTADANYTLVIVPCVQGVSGTGKNNGFKVEFGEGYVDNTIGYVGYKATAPAAAGDTTTILTASGGAYFPSGVGFLCVSVKSTVKLYIHPRWSGYMDGVYVAPSEDEINITLLSYGLSDLDWAERISDTTMKLHQYRKYLDLTTLEWTMTTIQGDETTTYQFTADMPEDGKTNGTFKTNDTLGMTLASRTYTITSTTITSVSDLLTALNGEFILYELTTPVVTDIEMSSSVSNSDFGGEFWIGTNVAPTAVNFSYGVSYVGYLRDDHKLIEIVNLVGAQAIVQNSKRIDAIERLLSNGMNSLTVENLTVTRTANLPS